MEASNKQIRECVVEFDERLSMKLNRSALTALANDLRREFLPITDGNKYLSTIESLRNEIKIWDGKFDQEVAYYEAKIDNVLESRVGSIIDQKFEQYTEVAQSFS